MHCILASTHKEGFAALYKVRIVWATHVWSAIEWCWWENPSMLLQPRLCLTHPLLSGVLLQGLTPALLAVVPAAGVDLAVYNTLRDVYVDRAVQKHRQLVMKHALQQQRLDIHCNPNSTRPPPTLDAALPIHLSLAFGAVAATSGAVVAYPLALIRTKMIAQGMPGHAVQYAGPLDCVRHVWRNNGLGGFYRGITPALLKAIPAISIGYGSYELTKNVLL